MVQEPMTLVGRLARFLEDGQPFRAIIWLKDAIHPRLRDEKLDLILAIRRQEASEQLHL
jgi:hypothetical protein